MTKKNVAQDLTPVPDLTPEDFEFAEPLGEFLNLLEKQSSSTVLGVLEDVKEVLERVRQNETEYALEQMEELAARLGFDIEELVQRKAEELVARQTGEPIRFQHPKNKALTWTGRGRIPRWLKDIQESGGNIEDFRIRA